MLFLFRYPYGVTAVSRLSAAHTPLLMVSRNAREFKLAESLTRFAVPLLLATHSRRGVPRDSSHRPRGCVGPPRRQARLPRQCAGPARALLRVGAPRAPGRRAPVARSRVSLDKAPIHATIALSLGHKSQDEPVVGRRRRGLHAVSGGCTAVHEPCTSTDEPCTDAHRRPHGRPRGPGTGRDGQPDACRARVGVARRRTLCRGSRGAIPGRARLG